MSKQSRSNRAAKLHAIAQELGVDPELVAAVGKGIRDEDAIKDAVRAYIAKEEAAAKETPSEDEPQPKRERKPGLTLSQRRALVKLQASPQTPSSAFRALPFEYLVDCGYARNVDGTYSLTCAGVERAESINPLYVVWSAGESVCGDKSRPAAGTHRAAATVGLEA